jgi:hypothetical protein
MLEDQEQLNPSSHDSKGGAQAPELLSPESARAELLLLLRLLLREPPVDHNFQTCPICQRYGITEI